MTMSGSEPDRGELGRLLQEAGSAYDARSVEALIEGVLAAPAEIGTSWHMLGCRPDDAGPGRRARSAAGGQGEGVPQWSRRPRISNFYRALLGSTVCAGNSRHRASTGSSCPEPTSTKANTCRRAGSGWLGSPALPGRPVWRSCSAIARRSSSMAATPCRQRRRSTSTRSKSTT